MAKHGPDWALLKAKNSETTEGEKTPQKHPFDQKEWILRSE
jgi:hypothetical protein